jgi:hypothetical protein
MVGAVWRIRDAAAVAWGFVVPEVALGCFEESHAAKRRHITAAAIEIVAFIKGAITVLDWLGFDVAFSVAKAKCKSRQSTIWWRWNVSLVSQAPVSRSRFALASVRCWECAESVALFPTFGD